MKRHFLTAVPALALILTTARAQSDPQFSSWYTSRSGQYARLVETDNDLSTGNSKTTWSRNNISQTLPVYAGIQEITYSTGWVYFKTSGLATYLMGPWYNDATRSPLFVNIPKNQNIHYRIPRTSTLAAAPATKTSTAGGGGGGTPEDAIGYFVDGVALFDPTDGWSYAAGTEASPGTGQWHRDAYMNEKVTFDVSMAHQQNTGKYHNHANPLALRYLLGDHVTYSVTNKTCAEGDPATPAAHSPIVGWLRDGLPLYGPYGYQSALDATSGVKRLVGGFVKRDGTTPGVDNINTTGRTALPAWATRNNGNVAASGPAVNTTYTMGRYVEDWAYRGDLTNPSTGQKYALGTDFDLNEYNVRYCVTPEFPNGTWAYFVNISSAGVPQFPYMTNRWYYGSPTGGTVTTLAETVTTLFSGGPNSAMAITGISRDSDTAAINLTWSSVEGGTYKVEQSTDLAGWSNLLTGIPSTTISTASSDTTAGDVPRRFYRVSRTSIASYDTGTAATGTDTGTGTGTGAQGITSVSPATGTRGSITPISLTLNGGYNPPPPAAAMPPTSVTLTKTGAATITATSFSRNATTGIVTANFSIPGGATAGAYTVNAVFGPNTWSLTTGFTVN